MVQMVANSYTQSGDFNDIMKLVLTELIPIF